MNAGHISPSVSLLQLSRGKNYCNQCMVICETIFKVQGHIKGGFTWVFPAAASMFSLVTKVMEEGGSTA